MLFIFLVVGISLFQFGESSSCINDPPSKKKPGLDCSNVRCSNFSKRDCGLQGKDYLPAGISRCCSRCVPKPGCDGIDDCSLVDCNPKVTEEWCSVRYLSFTPAIPTCKCCSSCDIDSQIYKCATSSETCTLVEKEDCEAIEKELVPPNYYDSCCPTCEEPSVNYNGEICRRNFCDTVRCAPQKEEDCRQDQIFIPRNGCTCCDRCFDLNPTDCSPNRCKEVKCKTIVKKDCDPITEEFIKADGLCNCCSYCRNKKCDGSACAATSCLSLDPKDCRENEEFVQGDGKCRCCNACVKIY